MSEEFTSNVPSGNTDGVSEAKWNSDFGDNFMEKEITAAHARRLIRGHIPHGYEMDSKKYYEGMYTYIFVLHPTTNSPAEDSGEGNGSGGTRKKVRKAALFIKPTQQVDVFDLPSEVLLDGDDPNDDHDEARGE